MSDPQDRTGASADPEDKAGIATADLIRCDQCGEEVAATPYCVRCGDPLAEERRRGRHGRVREGFAAAPEEAANMPGIVSTLFPALPRAHMRTFRVALVAGLAVMFAFTAFGLYPLAIAAAASLVPLLAVIYIYDVDVYEDEPIRIIALTFAWGAVAGAVFAWLVRELLPVSLVVGGGSLVPGASAGDDLPLARGVLVPLLAGALMAAGPIVLMLRQRRFDDVLDGATFGVASAVAFVGALTLVTAMSFLESGLRPAGDPIPWVARLLGLAVAQPLVAAGAVGGFMGVLWLRYRAPVRDRHILGLLGSPPVAAAAGAALLVVQALALELMGAVASLLVLIPLAIASLLWLRRILHVGLLQEAREIPIGPAAPCPDCDQMTVWHSYCGECGVAFAALPKQAPGKGDEHPAHPRPAQRPRLSDGVLVAVFGVALAASLLVAGALVLFLSRDLDQPDCPDPNLPCPGRGLAVAGLARQALDVEPLVAQAGETLPFSDWVTYSDTDAGFSLEYDPVFWQVGEAEAGYLSLVLGNGAALLVVEAVPADRFDDAGILKARRDIWDQNLLALARDDDPSRALVGTPILGHRPGAGRLFGASLDSAQGPALPVSLALVSASDPHITVVVSVLAAVADREVVFSFADSVLGTFTWPSEQTVGAATRSVASAAPMAAPSRTASSAIQPALPTGAHPAAAHVVGPADPDETVEVGLTLRGRDPDGLRAFLEGLADPASPLYRDFITPDEFGRRFGLAPELEQDLISRLVAAGMESHSLNPQRMLMRVRGTAAEIAGLFDVSLDLLEAPDGTRFVAADRVPTIPAELVSAVTGVTGLERSLPVSFAQVAAALPSRGLRPVDLALAYGADALHARGLRGEGTTVAILQFGLDTDEDLAVFDEAFEIDGPLPLRIAVDEGLVSAPPGFGGEAALDTQVVRAIAPGAQILVYGIPTRLGIAGGIDVIVADGRAQFISLSYGKCDVPGEWISLAERDAGRAALDAAMAAGVTVFSASGDWGAYTCQGFDTSDPRETVAWPTCQAGLVSVGGTYLEVQADGSYRRETGWQDYLSTGGTGGGVDPTEPMPAWQLDAGIADPAAGGRRQCPDVAAAADPDTGYLVYYTDQEGGFSGWRMVGGTSAAAPFWAGAMALVQQAAAQEGIDRLGFLAPVLYRTAASTPAAFNDVTRGGNLASQSGPGWDYATGLGSPNLPVLTEAILEELR